MPRGLLPGQHVCRAGAIRCGDRAPAKYRDGECPKESRAHREPACDRIVTRTGIHLSFDRDAVAAPARAGKVNAEVDALDTRESGEVPLDSLPLDLRGWMEREVDRAYGLIGPIVRVDTFKPYTNEEFEVAVDGLRLFARQRAAFVNLEVTAARAQP